MTGLPYRTHTELIGLLAEVDEALSKDTPAGIMYVLYVIGGAAVGSVLADRLTQDVDVATETIPPQVLEAAREVAERHGMPDTWINNQAAEFIEADLPVDAFETIIDGRCLLVRVARPETLLALKIMSGRGKDVNDLLDLAELTGIVYYADLMRLCDEVFSATPAYSLEREWTSNVCRDIHHLMAHKRSGASIEAPADRLAARLNGRDRPEEYGPGTRSIDG